MKVTFTITAFILSISLVSANWHQDPAYCNNETVKLTGYLGKNLPHNFIVSPILKCISVTHGEIRNIQEGAFDDVPNLMYLNLENNYIRPPNLFSFGNLPNVKSLILGNQLKKPLPWEITNDIMVVNTVYPKLLHLNLRNDKIESIKINVPNPFPKLTHLDLSNNHLSWFDLLLWSNTLMQLNLNNNQISKIWHKELKNLISLTVDDNRISSVGKNYDLDLSGLSSLEYLSISNNPITVLDDTAFVDTANLRCLNMSENGLTALEPEVFTPLISLEITILNNNMFRTIPFMKPLNISTLLMDCNRITNLTSNSLSMLPNLRKLSLAGNMISSIHVDTFKSQELLEELDLSDNELNHLPVHWDLHTENLRYLDLSGNKFISITPFLSTTITALEQVYLDDNPLKYVGGNSITIPENMTIYLNIGQKRSKPICVRRGKPDLIIVD
ncbi:podocan [Megachile rotundata]|uniref:podocan n=1 Tax=Megachile rotundata TaxID=143995 RepID=UPI000615158A|nr:PREDICTED: leucine-rich repeat-containing protein 15-like [Megachile rotundata]